MGNANNTKIETRRFCPDCGAEGGPEWDDDNNGAMFYCDNCHYSFKESNWARVVEGLLTVEEVSDAFNDLR